MRPLLPSPAAARRYLYGFEHVTGHGLEGFLETAVDRILTSLSLLPPLGPGSRVLEIGAQPYFMTALLLKHFPAEVRCVNEDDRGGGEDGRFELRRRDLDEPLDIEYDRFNIEFDDFPYGDETYDVVFLCEVIEHLGHDPVHAIHEINRVLKPGGRIILSTPNAMRLENFWKVVRGRNIYPPYSGWGITSRHNREFTKSELTRLLESNGFSVEMAAIHTDPGYSYAPFLKRITGQLERLRVGTAFLDDIHIRARKSGGPGYSYPEDMFFDVQAYGRVWASTLDMENAPESQLGRGIHRMEVWPPAIRWTGRESMFRLKRGKSHSQAAIRFYSGPKELDRPVTGRISTDGASTGFALEPDTWATVSVQIPPAGEREIIEVELDLDQSWSPAGLLGGADTRDLGVAVRRVWLE